MLQRKGLRTTELHEAFCQALLNAGASPPELLLPDGYNGMKADAVFVQERTIVEVKMVCKDQVSTEEVQRRLAPVIAKWGPLDGRWDEWPERKLADVEAVIAPRVPKNLREASQQIRETQAALGWETSYGVAAFVIPSSFGVNPGVIGRAAYRLMHGRPEEAPHVHSLHRCRGGSRG